MARKCSFIIVIGFCFAVCGVIGKHVSGSTDILEPLKHAETYKWYPEIAEQVCRQIEDSLPNSTGALKARENLVVSYITAKRYGKAQEALDKLTIDYNRADTELPATVYRIAALYEDCRKYSEAKSLYDQIIQKFPANFYVDKSRLAIRRIAVLSNIESKKYDSARSETADLIANFRNHPLLSSSLYDIARRYERAREYEKAENGYRQVIQLYPDSPAAAKAQMGIARINIYASIKSGQAESAIEQLLVDFSGNPALSESLYDIAVRYEWSGQYNGQGQYSGQYLEAARIYDRIITEYPDSHYGSKAQIDTLKARIYYSIQTGDYETAKSLVDVLIANYASHSYLPEVLYQIADRYQQFEKDEDAKSIYQQVAQQYPDSLFAPEALLFVASLNKISPLVAAGETDAVTNEINQLITDFNGNRALSKSLVTIGIKCYYKGNELLWAGSVEQAQNYFQMAKKIFAKVMGSLPESIPAWTRQEACLYASYCDYQLGHYEDAVKNSQEFIDKWPSYQDIHFLQLTIASSLEKLKESGIITASEADPQIEQNLKAVLEKKDVDGKLIACAARRLGQMYFDSGDWYDAAVNFELFLQQCPGSEEILLVLDKLGEAYENLGEIELSAELNYQFATPAAPNCLEVKAASKDRIKILAGSGR